jgi:flagellar basal body rod protein FlgB
MTKQKMIKENYANANSKTFKEKDAREKKYISKR